MITHARHAERVTLGTVVALALMAGLVAHAQATLTGKWQGETNNGSTILLDLTVEGTALKGTLTRNDVSTPITEGQVTNNTFSFKATINDETETVSGELAGNEIRAWLDRQGPSTAIVLKRVKAAPAD